MSRRKPSLGGVAWDIVWFVALAVSVAHELTHDWKAAIRYVLLGLLILGAADALREWPHAFDRWREARRERRREQP